MPATPDAPLRQRRNVLLIVVDQWRADCLHGLGPAPPRTPSLDRLRREGVTFRNHVTVAAPCGPARASLLTGLYTMTHRVVQNGFPQDARHVTLGHALAAAGYDPALVGYTDSLPDPRTTAPDDPRFRTAGAAMAGFRPVGDFEPGMDGYFRWLAGHGFALPEPREDIWRPQGGGAPGPTALPCLVPAELSDSRFYTAAALDYLAGRRGQPFFLHLGFLRPHPPFIAAAPYHALYRADDMPPPLRAVSIEAAARQHPLLDFFLKRSRQSQYFQGAAGLVRDLDEAALRQTRATYLGMMSEIDDCLGRVFAVLDAADLWRDTLVLFTSDHGEQMGDHHLLGKLGWFDASFRVPLVIRDPDATTTRGRIEPAFTESVDLMPTILDWLGAPPPPGLDGASLLPLLHGNAPAVWRDALHYEYDFRDNWYFEAQAALGVDADGAGLCVLHDARFKYVHFAALPPLLFDLAEDPHQLRNLAADPAHAATVRDYAQLMLSWRMRHADRAITAWRATPHGLRGPPVAGSLRSRGGR